MYSFQKQLIPWLGNTAYQTVMVPFLRSYWHWSSEQYSFHFSAPPRMTKELESAFSAPGERGLRTALGVIALALGITVATQHRDYFTDLDP
jgi:hypothetical protein